MAGKQETEYMLDVRKTVTIGADGRGTIFVGPDLAIERWEITSVQVANDGTNISQVRVFDSPTGTAPLEGTYSGRLDQSDTQFRLFPNMKLYYAWSGATVGSVSTLVVRGRKFLAGDRGGGI